MTSKELTAQGIDALKKGKKQEAYDLLEQAVELDPNNAKAWYFLSRVQTSVADKRTSLNTVLAIMPNNQLAKDALAKLDDEDFVVEEEFVEPEPRVYEEPKVKSHPNTEAYEQPQMNVPPALQSLPRMGIGAGNKTRIGNLQVPVAIEDAPESTEPQVIQNEFVHTIRSGYEILRRTPDVYLNEIHRASWWRFWQVVFIALAIGAVVSSLSAFILQTQLANSINNSPFVTEPVAAPSVFSMIFSMILFLPVNIILLYVGIYASYWFVTTRRNGQASFMRHAYTIMLPVITAGFMIDIANLVFAIVPILGTLVAIALFVLWVYSLYIAAQGMTMVHGIDDNSGYWTMGMFALATFAVGLVVSPLLLSVGLV